MKNTVKCDAGYKRISYEIKKIKAAYKKLNLDNTDLKTKFHDLLQQTQAIAKAKKMKRSDVPKAIKKVRKPIKKSKK